MRKRISIAFVALAALPGCEWIEKVNDARARHARAEELLQVQRDCNAKTAELQKSLEVETWGRWKDYQLQREGREVHLWRALGDTRDKDGNRHGTYCVLNPDPNQLWGCNAEQRKIGRILLEMEEVDKRFWAATNDLKDVWK